ncbi:MAG: tetratricopeptide repeat protein [Blastopirellula sp. JB062]
MTSPDSSSSAETRWSVVGWASLLTIATCCAYGNSFSGGYVLDDARYLTLENSANLANLPHRLGAVAAGQIRSVGNLSFTLNYLLIGDQPFAFHVGNLLIHLGAALILFDLLRRLFAAPYFHGRYAKSAASLAFVVALLWAVHPLTTMAVTYLIQRYESQSAFFYLLTIYCVVRSCLADDWRWAASSIVACGLAIGTKESTVSAPVVALALDRAIFAASWRELLRKRGWAYAGMGGVAAYFLIHLMPAFEAGTSLNRAVVGADRVSRWEYLTTESQVIVHYLRLALFPYPLCFDYEWPIARHWREYAATGAFVVGLLFAVGYSLRRCPPLGVAGLLFFGVLAPSSSFVPIADPAFEYRMYLPLAVVVLLAVIGVYELWRRSLEKRNQDETSLAIRYLPHGLTVVAAIALCGATLQRNQIYHSPETVWRSVVRLNPSHVRANHNLAKILKDQGRTEEAIAMLQDSLRRIDPANTAAAAIEIELGEVYARIGDFATAEPFFRRAIDAYERQTEPDSKTLRKAAEAHIGLGALLQQQGKWAESAPLLIAAAQLRPGLYPQAHGMAGIALREIDQLDEAERQLEQAIAASDADSPWTRELGEVYFRQGKLAEAARLYHRWLKRSPDDGEILLRLAWLRAAATSDDVRDLAEAKRLTDQLATRLGAQPPLLDLAATILAAEGKYAEAIQLCESALARLEPSSDQAKSMRKRLRLFQQARPFRWSHPEELF